jgi:hypothetical protein
VVGEAIEAEGAVVFAHAAGWTWRGSSKRAGNRYWSGRSRLGLKSKNPAFCADEPKGAKAQKIGLEEQARPLVRPHIDAHRCGSRVGEFAQSATQGACGCPASPTRV